jgi:hypothetical protein
VWVSSAANKDLMTKAFLAKTAVTAANGGQALTADDVTMTIEVEAAKLADDDDDSLDMAVIGGAVGGGVVFIIFIVVAIVCRRTRKDSAVAPNRKDAAVAPKHLKVAPVRILFAPQKSNTFR